MSDLVIHNSGITGGGSKHSIISDYDIEYANKQSLKEVASDCGGNLDDFSDLTSSTSTIMEGRSFDPDFVRVCVILLPVRPVHGRQCLRSS